MARSVLDRRALVTRFVGVLTVAHRERPARRGFVDGPDGRSEPAWVRYERGVLHTEVERACAQLSRPPVAVEALLRVEDSAVGHIDYTTKLAIACADLVLDEHSEPVR